MSKAEIASDLAACSAAFAKARIPWVVIDGIVLGYHREKGILEGDTDLDLGIFREITSQEWSRLYKALSDVGFGIRDLKQDFVYGRRKTKFNLWFYHKKGAYYESFPRSTPGIKFVEKAKWYDEFQLVKFLGSMYPMPSCLVDYLIHHYGKNWKVKKPGHDKWRKEKFGTSTGRFKPAIWLGSRCGPKGDLWPKILKVGQIL